MSMTERKWSTVIGILIVILGVLSLDIAGSMQAQDATTPLFEQRVIGSGEGYEGLPQEDEGIPINRQDPGNPEVLRQMREYALEMAKNSKPEPASGETTAGSLIYISGKALKLPDDVYIDHFIATVACIANLPCPRAPIYHLRQKGTGLDMSVSAVDGTLIDPDNTPEITAASRQAFQWLADAVPTKTTK